MHLSRIAHLLLWLSLLAPTALAAPARPESRARHPTHVPASAPFVLAGADLASSPVAALAAQVDEAQAQLDVLSSGARSAKLSDAELKGRLDAVPPVQAKLSDALDDLTPLLQSADARLAQLGPAPGRGQPAEDPEITEDRARILKFRESVDTEAKLARLLTTEADQLSAHLVDRRRELFSAQIWVRSRSVLDPTLWQAVSAAAPRDLQRVQTALEDEAARGNRAAQSRGALTVWGLAVFGALLLVLPARMLLNRLGETSVVHAVTAGRLRLSVLALWLVAVAGLTPLMAGHLLHAAFSGTNALTPAASQLLGLVFDAVVFAAILEGLGRALLSPGKPACRLAPIPDAVVGKLVAFPALIGASAALASFVSGANSVLGASAPAASASTCVGVLAELVAIGGALLVAGRARTEQLDAALQHDAPSEPASARPASSQAGSRLPWVLAALAAWLALCAAGVALLAGYIALASFIMREVVWVAMVLASLFLLLRFVDDLFPTLLAPDRSAGRFVRQAIGLSAGAMEQSAELLAGLFRLIVLLLGWAAILAPFGAGAQDVFGRVTSTDLVIRLGQVSISPGAIFGALVVFGLGLAATRAVRGWLESRYLPKTRMDVGVRTSIAAAVTYLGAVVALVLTCAYLGLSLDRIALFASALSVGIGFGLQAVIGNFVSGLILLAERPIKVGDWIAIGDMEGDVRRVNVRATEIEMPDRSKLIVPNSDLISKTVRNVTHSGSVGRVKIVLLIANGADPLSVRELLLARLREHPKVLADPAAAVYLTEVRDGAVEFTAFAYVASPRLVFATKSDLLFQIVPELKAQGIALANSTPVVNVGISDRAIEPGPASS